MRSKERLVDTMKEKILESIRNLAKELGRTPSQREFKKSSKISEFHIQNHFTSWNEAVRTAGFDPNEKNFKLDGNVLLSEWAEFVKRKGKIPTIGEYRRGGKHSPQSLTKRFGKWSDLPEKFREFAENKSGFEDVLALLPENKPLGKKPDSDAIIKNSASKNSKHSKLGDRTTYGNPLNFRGLLHEPVNENGVIFIFGMVADELGYSVEAIQPGFPDCEAKRRISNGLLQRVRIEFEFESRNFKDHGHAADGCDVIVCWHHNWRDCPPHLEVIELKTRIQSLPAVGTSG